MFDSRKEAMHILQECRRQVVKSTWYGCPGSTILTHAIGHLIGARYSSVDSVFFPEVDTNATLP